jgi:LacI family transcriptional regulator
MVRELHELGVPVVNVSAIVLRGSDFPRVTTDTDAAAKMAAEHFLERGYRHFAYVGPLDLAHVRGHADAFGRVAETVQASYQVFDYRLGAPGVRHDTGHGDGDGSWPQRQRELSHWLARLPKPVGVFSWATEAGVRVLDVCRYLSIPTPDDVAVLGGDDDPLLCDTASPPLSGVLVASEQIGFQAAARLDRLMSATGRARGDGKAEPPAELIRPITVTTRGSTEALAIEDPELRAAMTFLRQNACNPIGVDEIADAVPMARRSLERKFHDLVNRTPLEEIRRLRLARVRELLASTDRSVADIAAASGFGTPEYMTAIFRRFEGITPLRYRRKVRGLL